MSITAIFLVCAGLGLANGVQAGTTNQVPTTVGAALLGRSYSIDPIPFFRMLRRDIGEKEVQSDALVLCQYFKRHGIDVSPPSSISFKSDTDSIVVFSTKDNLERIETLLPPPPPPRRIMFTRTYGVGTNEFARMRRAIRADDSQRDLQVLREFLRLKGVDISPPTGFFYTVGQKALTVNAGREDIDKIERLLAEMAAEK